jgi:hypothetical protein
MIMNKKITIWAVWAAIVLAGCAIIFFIVGFLRKENVSLPAPRSDVIVTSTVSLGNILIKNETAGYAILIPQNWYLEKSKGSGATVYPNYGGTSTAAPRCKIEISALRNPDHKDLASWLTAYLRSDPTADVSEISQTTTTVGGAPAIIWHGALNEVGTTLAYIAAGTTVYELAPSVIAVGGGGASLSADCENNLSIVLKNFEFLK